MLNENIIRLLHYNTSKCMTAYQRKNLYIREQAQSRLQSAEAWAFVRARLSFICKTS